MTETPKRVSAIDHINAIRELTKGGAVDEQIRVAVERHLDALVDPTGCFRLTVDDAAEIGGIATHCRNWYALGEYVFPYGRPATEVLERLRKRDEEGCYAPPKYLFLVIVDGDPAMPIGVFGLNSTAYDVAARIENARVETIELNPVVSHADAE